MLRKFNIYEFIQFNYYFSPFQDFASLRLCAMNYSG